MSNINSLRKHLFDAIEGVKKGTMSVERAKAISDIGQTIINTAKLEVDFCKVTGETLVDSFMPIQSTKSNLPAGYTGIRVHKIK